jgi:hypothetical protein
MSGSETSCCSLAGDIPKPRFLALLLISSLLLTAAGPAASQCGGTPQCAQAPIPFGLPPSATEMNPGGNWFEVGGPPGVCYPTAGTIVGTTASQIPLTESQFFTVGSPNGPAIEVFFGGVMTPFYLTGTTINAGGVMCFPRLAEALTITDQVIAGLSGGIVYEIQIPAGVAPVSAAGIATCGRISGRTFTFVVQLSDNTIHAILGGVERVFTIPSPIVAPPESWTNGPVSGVLVFDNLNYHIISGGVMTSTALGGAYVSHTYAVGGVNVTTTAGPVYIPLAPAVSIVAFAPCNAPLVSCPTPNGMGIAMNTAPCPQVKGASATWPMPGISCMTPAAWNDAKKKPRKRKKFIGLYAKGEVVPGLASKKFVPGVISDGQTLSTGIQPGLGLGGIALARATATATQVGNRLSISYEGSFVKAVYWGEQGFARAVWRGFDPFFYEDWDDTEDLLIELDIDPGISLQTYPEHSDGFSSTELITRCSIPGLEDLFNAKIAATHDGASPTLTVEVTTDPDLGLDDAALAAQLADAFVYDEDLDSYVVDGTKSPLQYSVDIPDGVSSFEVRTNGSGLSYAARGGAVVAEHWCGDGVYDPGLGEECDHPNGDTCSEDCHLIGNWDCNTNSIADFQDIHDFTSHDCNRNFVPDECDIASGTSVDENGDGFPDECDDVLSGVGDLDDLPMVPGNKHLLAAKPNPFNAATDIVFRLAEPAVVRIAVYDLRGNHVRSLLEQEYGEGTHSIRWNGQDDSGSVVSSGVYFVRLSLDGVQEILKVALMK